MPQPPEARVRSLRTPESGIALVVLLVVALFVALVGVAMTGSAISELQSAGAERTSVQARYLAEAGIADFANHLTVNNAYSTTITQALGAGSYTVQLDTTRSQTGNLGAVKIVVSTGTVFAGSPAAASQTVRETFLVLPKAFSKAMLSNTTVSTCAALTCDAGGYTPVVTNNVLRQLGAIHANNLKAAGVAVSLVAGTEAVGQITASSGGVTPTGWCIACNAQTNQPQIPFPQFNIAHYQTLATANGTNFASQAAFDTYVSGLPVSGVFRTINGIVFVNTSGSLTLPNVAAEQNLRINGTLIVWATGPFGDLNMNSALAHNITITAQNGEPAVILGGEAFFTGTSSGTLTVNGLFYILAYSNNPVTTVPGCPGYDLPGTTAAPVTIKGMLVGQNLGGSTCPAGGMDSNSLTYDPSSFFAGLPSGLLTPTSLNPFVLLPISWSSAK